MERVIYKYKVGEKIENCEKILCVDMQGDDMYVWAIVCPNSKKGKTVTTYIQGTGWPLDDVTDYEHYIGTVQCGIYVWHVFWTEFNGM